MPALHMPLQSGSDKILQLMRRSYRRDKYLGIIERVRAAMPEAAITTDIIVGFPGETETDFLDTVDLVQQARFANAFTYLYSARPGTPAAQMPDQVTKEVQQDRYERLTEISNQIIWNENSNLIGSQVEVLVAVGEGKKDEQTGRLSGRARDNRLVHFIPSETVRPGDLVEVEITAAAPFHLISDLPIIQETPTRAGDVWQDQKSAPKNTVGLGMPTLLVSSK
jgi:tRNA-2-methylthio-N6-dimethylallyladenosine synthase